MYKHIANSYNQLHAAEQERKLSVLLARADLSEYESLIDVGAGTAHLAKHFKHLRYVALDPEQALLAQAPKHVTTVVARGEEIPYPNNSFDCALSLTALHNYQDPLRGVAELVRITKHLVLVGVLKKSSLHDEIVSELNNLLDVEHTIHDQHDTLIVARVRNS